MKPSKKKLNTYRSKITQEQISFLLKNEVKVYPVSDRGFWYVQVECYGKIKTYNKVIGCGSVLSSEKPDYKDVNWLDAIEKTMLYYYDKIKNPKK